MDIASGERNLSELPWSSLFAKYSIICGFLVFHLCALVVGLVLTCFGLRNGTTIPSLFTKSGLFTIGLSVLITRFSKRVDFTQGCWTKIFETKELSRWFDWRIISLLTGAGLSYFSSVHWIGNFITDGSPLLFLFPIEYIDLGFSLMRTHIRTARHIKIIIIVAIISYVGSICIVSTVTWWVLPFWIRGIRFLDCLAFGAICSCVDPNLCTKFLGLERPTTHSLHYSLVGEYVISNFLGGLVVLYIHKCKFPILRGCVIFVMIYLSSGLIGNRLGQLYSSVWDKYEPIFLEERRMLLYKVSFGIWCFLFVAFSITSWPHLDLSMVAIAFSTTIVHLTGLRPLHTYNYISSYLDLGSYMRMGLFVFHGLHSWSAYPLVLPMVLLFISIIGRFPAVVLQFYLSGRVMTIAELWIIWLAGIVRGGYNLTLAMTVFGTPSNESHTFFMSAIISMVLVTNLFIGLFSPWIVSRNFPLSVDETIHRNARMMARLDALEVDSNDLNRRMASLRIEIDSVAAIQRVSARHRLTTHHRGNR